MQPSRKSRLAAKTADLAIELDESFLRQVFRFGHVTRHTQTQRIDPSVMPLVEFLKGCHVAAGRRLRQCVVACWGCGLSINWDTSGALPEWKGCRVCAHSLTLQQAQCQRRVR